MSEIIPTNVPPENRPQPTNEERNRTIICECCGSKLDRKGGLLRRGELAREYLDAEDTIHKLKKQLEKAGEESAALRQQLDEAKAQIPTATERKSLWSRDA